jgi:DNA-binding CsgD family transcriptional regulator
MLIALLAALGVDLIVIAVLLALVVARKRWSSGDRAPSTVRSGSRTESSKVSDQRGPPVRRPGAIAHPTANRRGNGAPRFRRRPARRLRRRPASERPTGRPLLEPLSDREVVVLRFLPTMMSNAEIASEMFVSVNTVKTHLKHVYRKLDVSDRRAAVVRGRDLRLLSRGLAER